MTPFMETGNIAGWKRGLLFKKKAKNSESHKSTISDERETIAEKNKTKEIEKAKQQKEILEKQSKRILEECEMEEIGKRDKIILKKAE